MILTLPWPPSVNSYWRHPSRGPLAGRHLISEAGRLYRTSVWALAPRRAVLTGRLSVVIEAYPPDRRARDIDNLPKAPLDALTHAGVWTDDSQIDKLTIERCAVVKGGRLDITIEIIADVCKSPQFHSIQEHP